MRKTMTAVAAAMTMSFGAAQAADEEQILDLKDFDKIEIAGVYTIDVQVGPEYSVMLSGEEEALERAKASVKAGVLRLDRTEKRGKNRWKFGKHEDHGVTAVITLPALNAINVSGVVEGVVAGVDADAFRIDMSGVGDLEIDGKCETLDLKISGVGDLDAEKLECRMVDVAMSGVGDATVFASDEIDARISGMGDLDVYGSPEKQHTDSSMFSDVTIR